jgi:threonyl-tRNA synthetase
MEKIKIKFPDGNEKEFEKGINAIEIAKSISEGLAREVVAVKINDELKDAFLPINDNAKIQLLKFEDPEGFEVFRHSSAHLLAQAVLRIWPNAKPTIGPVVNEGFYYDFDIDHNFTPEDLEKIEEEMKKIVKENYEVSRHDPSKEELIEQFKHNEYKIEMINNLEEGASMYEQGEFKDLCRGPHIPSTGMIKALKLTKIAGAYWRADAKNKQLQRIYGITFPDKKMLKDYLDRLEEAEKRDHRKIGKELDLFSFHLEAPGMPFFHDKGFFIYNKLANFMTEQMKKRNYEFIKTPLILNKSLWLQSGHWDHYKDNMYFTKIDSNEDNFAVKPMNCPGHILVYKNKSYSYRNLPLKMGEFGIVHRHELSGVLSGLFRVRSFTQDDAHVFCTKEQIKNEVKELLDLVDEVYSAFGFEYKMELSTRPEKAMGEKELWDVAEKELKNALEDKEYKLNEGDGAFYGPKIDFHLKDAIGRTWQCGTIQLDFQMPEKFNLSYEGNDGKKHPPVMIHRAIYGSFERFLGILVEHYAGKFPMWLSPNQIIILPIADRHNEYCEELKKEFQINDLRADIDLRSESTKKKVRDAQLQQYNYILVIGDKEIENKSVNIRTRDNIVHGEKKTEEFIKNLLKEIKGRE